MAETLSNGVSMTKPSLWYRLGFHYSSDEDLFNWRNQEPPEEGFAPGAFCTVIGVRISFLDRLRILASGHCQISVYTKTDVMPLKIKSRSIFAVLPP